MYSDYDLGSDYYAEWDELTDFPETPLDDGILELFEDDTPPEWGEEDYRAFDIRR